MTARENIFKKGSAGVFCNFKTVLFLVFSLLVMPCLVSAELVIDGVIFNNFKDTYLRGDGEYLYNDLTTMYFNDSRLNLTIEDKISGKLDMADQRYNDSPRIVSANSSMKDYVDARVFGNTTSEIWVVLDNGTFLYSSDQRYNESMQIISANSSMRDYVDAMKFGNTTAEIWVITDNGTFLYISDQRYNDSSQIVLANDSIRAYIDSKVFGNTTLEIWAVVDNGTFLYASDQRFNDSSKAEYSFGSNNFDGTGDFTTTGTGTFGIGRFTTGIYDNTIAPKFSIDTGARKLYDSDGATIQLDYSRANALSGAGAGAPRPYSNFFGTDAGYGISDSVTDSNFFGQYSGYEATGVMDSNFFGESSGYRATNAYDSNFFGKGSGRDATNADNSNFFGVGAGRGAKGATGSNFFGINAGYGASNAQYSNFIGYRAGWTATNAADSIFIGSFAGYLDSVNNYYTDGTSIAIGKYAGTGGFSNSISIGRGVINSKTLQANIGNVLKIDGIYNSDTQSSALITTANTTLGGNLNVTGNITAGYFIGDGSLLTGVSSGTADYQFTTNNFNGSGNFITTGNIRFGDALDTSGIELIDDPDFNNASGEWAGSYWRCDSGLAQHQLAGSTDLYETEPFTVIPYQLYKVQLEITQAGSTYIHIGGASGSGITATGNHTQFIKAVNSNSFNISSTVGSKFNSVSVKKVGNAEIGDFIARGNASIEDDLYVKDDLSVGGDVSIGGLTLNPGEISITGTSSSGDAVEVFYVLGGTGGIGWGQDGGKGGNITLRTGTGGLVDETFTAGKGGDLSIATGAGGNCNSDGTGGNGGDILLTTGSGGTSNCETPGNYGNIIMANDGGHVQIGSASHIANITMFTNPSGNPACCGVMDDYSWKCSPGACT